VLLVSLVSTGAALDNGVLGFVGIVVYELIMGVVLGLAVGFGGAWMMRRVALPSSGLYPLAVLSFTILAYAGTAALHASGFAAVYTAALVLGNSELPHRAATRSFSEGVAWIAQIGLFVMLGLLASPGRISLEHVVIAVLAGLLLTFVARPLSVLACAFAHRLSVREQLFVSWAGLRGAVPIVLTTIPLAEEVNGSEELFDIVFVMVVIYTLVTGPTLPWVAARLGVTERGGPRDLDVEAAPLERVAADLLQISITEQSRLHGVEVAELRLPVGASVSLVVRAGRTLVPDARTVLRHGDELLVVTPRKLREATEGRLRAVSRRGRLAHWLDAPEPR
jgi:cell volume regulation protein A